MVAVQDTVQEMAKNMKTNKTGATQASASELYDFMKRVCSIYNSGGPLQVHATVPALPFASWQNIHTASLG